MLKLRIRLTKISILAVSMLFCLVCFNAVGQPSSAEGVTAIDVTIDGTAYATGHEDASVRIWGKESKNLLITIPRPNFALLSAKDRFFVNEVSFDPAGEKLAVTFGGVMGLFRIIDSNTGQILTEKTLGDDAGAVDWHPDGTQLAVLSSVGLGPSARASLYLFSENGSDLSRTDSSGPSDLALDWSPTGDFIALGDMTTVVVRDSTSLQSVEELTGHADYITSVAWSPDGSQIASTDSESVRIWDWNAKTQTGQLKSEFPKTQGRGIPRVVWSPAGTMIASSSNPLVEVWDIDDEMPLFSISAGYSYGLLWLHDGRIVSVSGAVEALEPASTITLTPIYMPTETFTPTATPAFTLTSTINGT